MLGGKASHVVQKGGSNTVGEGEADAKCLCGRDGNARQEKSRVVWAEQQGAQLGSGVQMVWGPDLDGHPQVRGGGGRRSSGKTVLPWTGAGRTPLLRGL